MFATQTRDKKEKPRVACQHSMPRITHLYPIPRACHPYRTLVRWPSWVALFYRFLGNNMSNVINNDLPLSPIIFNGDFKIKKLSRLTLLNQT